MFSDGLLGALQHGHPSLGPRLSLSELGDLVKARLKESYPENWVRPEIHSPDQREGDVASVCLFPNPVFGDVSAPPETVLSPQTIARPPKIPPEQPRVVSEGSWQVAKPIEPRVTAPHLPPKVVAAEAAAPAIKPPIAMPAPGDPLVAPDPVPSARTTSYDATPPPAEDIEAPRRGFFHRRAVVVGAIVLAVLASVIWYVGTAPERKREEAQTHMLTGDARRSDGKFDEAISEYRQSLAINPVPAAYEGLGLALLGKGDTAGATEPFRQALAMMPDYPENHYNLALALAMQGDRAGANAEFGKVVSPNSPSGFWLPGSDNPCPVTIAIKKNESLVLNEEPIGWDDLGKRLVSIYQIRAQRVMCIAPESPDSFLRVENVAKIANNSGVDRLCIVPPAFGTK
jgi:tetratricopeptide (TPR) repeat protein